MKTTAKCRQHSPSQQPLGVDGNKKALGNALELIRAQGVFDSLLDTLREARSYRLAELADLSSISTKELRRHIDRGELRARKLGYRTLVVRHTDWVAFLESPKRDA